MSPLRVLIVEDELLIALDVEQALIAAGYEICGVASSEAEALAMADTMRPDLAVVDINLNPGDGRNVARALSDRHKTAVLFATSQCTELDRRMGAIACLPKPYLADDVPAALRAIEAIADGQTPVLPDHMFALA
jgi:DNA-binding response OmpR family regulator